MHMLKKSPAINLDSLAFHFTVAAEPAVGSSLLKSYQHQVKYIVLLIKRFVYQVTA